MKKFFVRPVRLLALVVLVSTSAVLEASPANARERNSSEIQCIAKTIHGEARGESREGKVAVGLVVMARASDGRWPGSACGVVKQRGQFNGYYNSGSPSKEVMDIATAVYVGKYSLRSIFGRGNECVRYFDNRKRNFMREVKKIDGHWFGC